MSHVDLLKLLLPCCYDANGAALSVELAAEGAALDWSLASADQLLAEMDPRTTAALLPDWERVYALPDRCIVAAGVAQSSSERRAALVALEEMTGGQSIAFFIAQAAALGYTITIEEMRPRTTEDTSETPVQDEQYRAIWKVKSALFSIRERCTEDDTEMATAVWGNKLLECRLNRFKPAHTLILFSYQ